MPEIRGLDTFVRNKLAVVNVGWTMMNTYELIKSIRRTYPDYIAEDSVSEEAARPTHWDSI